MESPKPQSIVHQLARTSGHVRHQITKRFSSKPNTSSSRPPFLGNDLGLNRPAPSSCEDFIGQALEIASMKSNTKKISSDHGADAYALSTDSYRESHDKAVRMRRSRSNARSNSSISIIGKPPKVPLERSEALADKGYKQATMKAQIEQSDDCAKDILPLVTINQNDFMMECLIDTSRPCFIHFFAEDSKVSEALDQELGELHALCAEQSLPNEGCRFMRIPAKAAPFITAKMQISNKEPSVICLHSGNVFERVTDAEKMVQFPGQVKQWAVGTGLMGL
ncbi:MAG: hypothetical protein SGILL_006888 [Bacillariaceae sp.]